MVSPINLSLHDFRSDDLRRALERIEGVPLMVTGDVILDRYIWGNVNRISPEAPVPIVEVKKTEDRLGGACNVARNLRRLGAKVVMCGLVGDDDQGQSVRDMLEADGVDISGLMIDAQRPTALKTRVIAHHQQVVRIDREKPENNNVELNNRFAALVQKKITEVRGVILSDYGKGTISPQLLAMLEDSRGQGKLSLRSCPLVVDPHPANYWNYQGMSLAKPNRKEAELATGVSITDKASAIVAADMLIRRWRADMSMITLGEDGLVIAFADGSAPIFLETVAQQVFDVSGAGDTVTAVFTAAIATGTDIRTSGMLANMSAGQVVSKVGTVSVDRAELLQSIAEVGSAPK